VKSVQRCVALSQLLTEQNFPAIGIHRGMTQEERLNRYQQFKDFQKRIPRRQHVGICSTCSRCKTNEMCRITREIFVTDLFRTQHLKKS